MTQIRENKDSEDNKPTVIIKERVSAEHKPNLREATFASRKSSKTRFELWSTVVSFILNARKRFL